MRRLWGRLRAWTRDDDGAATAEFAVVLPVVVVAAAPAGVQVTVAESGGHITVTTTCHVLADPLGVLPTTVHGRAVVVKQE